MGANVLQKGRRGRSPICWMASSELAANAALLVRRILSLAPLALADKFFDIALDAEPEVADADLAKSVVSQAKKCSLLIKGSTAQIQY